MPTHPFSRAGAASVAWLRLDVPDQLYADLIASAWGERLKLNTFIAEQLAEWLNTHEGRAHTTLAAAQEEDLSGPCAKLEVALPTLLKLRLNGSLRKVYGERLRREMLVRLMRQLVTFHVNGDLLPAA